MSEKDIQLAQAASANLREKIYENAVAFGDEVMNHLNDASSSFKHVHVLSSKSATDDNWELASEIIANGMRWDCLLARLQIPLDERVTVFIREVGVDTEGGIITGYLRVSYGWKAFPNE